MSSDFYGEDRISLGNMPSASWGPTFWPSLRSSARDTTIKAIRGTVAIKGIFDNRASVPVTRGSVPLTAPLVPLMGDPFPLRASFNCFVVGFGPGAFNCQRYGVSLRI